MPFMEDFEKTAKKVLSEAGHVAEKALQTAGQVTHANRDKIEHALDKAGEFVDSKTDGKYTSQVAKAKSAAGKGVDFVAAQKSGPVSPRAAQQSDSGAASGPNASWQDTTQDRMGGAQHGQGAAHETNYPNPIPPYTPPTQH